MPITFSNAETIALYMSVLFLSTCFMYMAEHKKRKYKMYLFLTILIVSLPAIFRYEVGTDCVGYSKYLLVYLGDANDFSDFIRINYKEPSVAVIFYIAKILFGELRYGFSIYAVLTHSLIVLGIWKYRKLVFPHKAVFAYIALFYLSTFNLFRQFLAVAIIFYYFDLIFKKKYIKFLVIVLIATMCHYSALVSLLMIPYYKSQNGQMQRTMDFIKMYILPTVMILIAVVSVPLMRYIPVISVYAENYARIYSFSSILTIGTFVEILIIGIYFLYQRRKIDKRKNDFNIMLDKAFAIKEVFYFFGFLLGDVSRIGIYFYFPSVLAFASIGNKNSRLTRISKWQLYVIIYLLAIFIKDVVGGAQGSMPYKFMF